MDDQTPVTPHGLDGWSTACPGSSRACGSRRGSGSKPDQVLAVEGLILNMAARGSLPETLHGFKTLLGPIACSSKWQQDEFARQFDAWAARLAPGEAPPSPRPTPDLGRTLNEVGEHGRGAWLRSWPMLAIGAAFILATAYIVFDWLTPDRPATPPPGNPGKTGPGWRVVVLAGTICLGPDLAAGGVRRGGGGRIRAGGRLLADPEMVTVVVGAGGGDDPAAGRPRARRGTTVLKIGRRTLGR